MINSTNIVSFAGLTGVVFSSPETEHASPDHLIELNLHVTLGQAVRIMAIVGEPAALPMALTAAGVS